MVRSADRLALHQPGVGEALQNPCEDRFMRLNIDQPARPRNRRMIRRRVRQHQPEKVAQHERIGCTPCDGAPRIRAFEVADQQQTEIAPRRQARAADLVSVEALTQSLDVAVKVMLVENLIQSCVERMRGTAWKVLGRHRTSTPASRVAVVYPSPSAPV
jgi:hypothetical protein